MELISNGETSGFSFIWKIHNFSYCLEKFNCALASPVFELEDCPDKQFYLNLYPKGNENPYTIGCFLQSNKCVVSPLEICFELAVRNSKGSYEKSNSLTGDLKFRGKQGTPALLEQNAKNAYLIDDTLTIRCRMLLINDKEVSCGQCHARTIISVEQKSFIWSLNIFEDFPLWSEESKQLPVFTQIPYSTISLLVAQGNLTEDKIQLQIKLNNVFEEVLLVCQISLLDASGKSVHLLREEGWFDTLPGEQVWNLSSFPKNKLLQRKTHYLPNGVLSLRCEFIVSSGDEYSKVERTEYGIPEDRQLQFTSNRNDFSGSLTDNLSSFYIQGKFSDFTIYVPSRQFPVHKAILCARSKVFAAMFERDITKSQNGSVEIKDLDENILSQMLLFMYTDKVEDLNWRSACDLYFAADKYEIVALKRICTTFLKDNLGISNVGELLSLSDRHQDEELKLATQDYVHKHIHEMMNSGEWKTTLKADANSSSEKMQLLFFKT